MHSHQAVHEMENCIKTCTETQDVCFRTLGQCINKGGMRAQPRVVEALMSCGEICGMHLKLMLSGSEVAHIVAKACAEICEYTASICDEFAKDDLELEHAAQVCRRCAQTCHRVEQYHAA